MASSNWDQVFKHVVDSEGGYSNHPDDPGGPTYRGVTLATYRNYVDKKGTISDLKSMTTKEIKDLYKKQYWDPVKGDQLPSGVDALAFDFAINSGPAQAVRELQRVVGAKVDGVIGPETMAKIRAYNPAAFVKDYAQQRMGFLKGLKNWGTFGNGWTNRVNSLSKFASKLVGNAGKDLGQFPFAGPQQSATAGIRAPGEVVDKVTPQWEWSTLNRSPEEFPVPNARPGPMQGPPMAPPSPGVPSPRFSSIPQARPNVDSRIDEKLARIGGGDQVRGNLNVFSPEWGGPPAMGPTDQIGDFWSRQQGAVYGRGYTPSAMDLVKPIETPSQQQVDIASGALAQKWAKGYDQISQAYQPQTGPKAPTPRSRVEPMATLSEAEKQPPTIGKYGPTISSDPARAARQWEDINRRAGMPPEGIKIQLPGVSGTTSNMPSPRSLRGDVVPDQIRNTELGHLAQKGAPLFGPERFGPDMSDLQKQFDDMSPVNWDGVNVITDNIPSAVDSGWANSPLPPMQGPPMAPAARPSVFNPTTYPGSSSAGIDLLSPQRSMVSASNARPAPVQPTTYPGSVGIKSPTPASATAAPAYSREINLTDSNTLGSPMDLPSVADAVASYSAGAGKPSSDPIGHLEQMLGPGQITDMLRGETPASVAPVTPKPPQATNLSYFGDIAGVGAGAPPALDQAVGTTDAALQPLEEVSIPSLDQTVPGQPTAPPNPATQPANPQAPAATPRVPQPGVARFPGMQDIPAVQTAKALYDYSQSGTGNKSVFTSPTTGQTYTGGTASAIAAGYAAGGGSGKFNTNAYQSSLRSQFPSRYSGSSGGHVDALNTQSDYFGAKEAISSGSANPSGVAGALM
jgi:lysozyme family protein